MIMSLKLSMYIKHPDPKGENRQKGVMESY
jgi:hypothetical protein